MLIERTDQFLPDRQSADTAVLAWLEMMISGRDGTGPFRLEGLENDDDPTRLRLFVWSGHDLHAVAVGHEVFKGGQWALTTWDLSRTNAAAREKPPGPAGVQPRSRRDWR